MWQGNTLIHSGTRYTLLKHFSVGILARLVFLVRKNVTNSRFQSYLNNNLLQSNSSWSTNTNITVYRSSYEWNSNTYIRESVETVKMRLKSFVGMSGPSGNQLMQILIQIATKSTVQFCNWYNERAVVFNVVWMNITNSLWKE